MVGAKLLSDSLAVSRPFLYLTCQIQNKARSHLTGDLVTIARKAGDFISSLTFLKRTKEISNAKNDWKYNDWDYSFLEPPSVFNMILFQVLLGREKRLENKVLLLFFFFLVVFVLVLIFILQRPHTIFLLQVVVLWSIYQPSAKLIQFNRVNF